MTEKKHIIKQLIITLIFLSFLIFYSSSKHAAGAAYTYDSLNRLASAEYESGLFIEYKYDNAGNITRVKVNEALLAAVVIGFEAEGCEDHVLLKWKTGSEPDNAGFHILRSDQIPGTPYFKFRGHLT